MQLSDRVAYVGAPLSKVPGGVTTVPVLKIVYRDVSSVKSIETSLALTSKRAVISLKMSGVRISGARIYCIGEETSKYLKNLYSLECIVPDTQDSQGLARIIAGNEKEITVVGSNMISDNLLSTLRDNGIRVNVVAAYEIVENPDARYEDLGSVTKILVGSSHSFEILYRRAAKYIEGKRIYAIGRPTFNTISKSGLVPAGFFERPSIWEILVAMVNNSEKRLLATP